MKRFFLITLSLSIVLSTISCEENSTNRKHSKNNIDKEIEHWLSTTGIPSVSIVLFEKGKILKSDAYGYSNLIRKTPATTSTIYNTGSNFKSVTSTAIMQLEEKGLIDINRPVNDFLKQPIEYYEENAPITAKHLMSHQSGIPTSVGMNKVWERKSIRTLQEIVSAIEPNLKPQQKYQYSNDGYSLLGLLIEDVTGTTYEKYIWENIFEPLGVETYGFMNPSPEMIENLAMPYHVRYNKAYPTNQVHLEQYPAGDTYLKPMDMAKFLMMHLNDGEFAGAKILSNESVQKMHQPYIKIGENSTYGFGFAIDKIEGKKFSNHQGSLPGYLSAFTIDFETKSGVYLATNVSATPLQEKQIQLLLKFLFEYVRTNEVIADLEIPLESQTVEVSANNLQLEKYVGKYKIIDTPVYLTIDRIGDQLFLINPANERFRIEYLSQNKFFITTENEDIEFKKTEDGIESLTLFSGGNEIKANRE